MIDMNGTQAVTSASSIKSLRPLYVLNEDELDSVWVRVRRQATRDADVYDALADEHSLDDLAAAAIDAAMATEIGGNSELPRSQRRRLFFEYLEALLAHVPR